jgi:hypothetical protein
LRYYSFLKKKNEKENWDREYISTNCHIYFVFGLDDAVGVSGVAYTVTVGYGVGRGFAGTRASRGSALGFEMTTATTPRVEKFA